MKRIQTVMMIALVVIAANMTLSNFKGTSSATQVNVGAVEEKVLPVIGRAYVTFDGMGASVGFLVKDGADLKVIRYDKGSMADNEMFQPRYLSVARFSDGRIAMDPLQVERFTN